MGVAVLVTADPRPEAQEGVKGRGRSSEDLDPAPVQLGVDGRDDVHQEVEVEADVAGLVQDRRAHRAQLLGLPEQLHVAAHGGDQGGVAGRAGRWAVEGVQGHRHPVDVIEDRAADRLGGVGGDHGHDVQVGEGGEQPLAPAREVGGAGEEVVECPRGGRPSGRDRLDPPDHLDPVLQLSHVDQLEVEGEGPDQPGGGAHVDLAQLAVEGPADRLVVALAELLGLCPDLLLEHEERLSLLPRQGLAEQGAHQADVAPQAPLGIGIGARRYGVRLVGHLPSMPPHRLCAPWACRTSTGRDARPLTAPLPRAGSPRTGGEGLPSSTSPS